MSPALYRCDVHSILLFQKHLVRRVPIKHLRKIIGFTTVSVGAAVAKGGDVVDITDLKSGLLTREECIKQACLLSVNSASTLLTTTSSALLDISKEYRDSLCRIISLLEQLQTVEGDNPQIWDALVEARLKVNKAKAALTELNCYMESVEKVVNSTTEAAFLAGADYMCTVLCERLYSAQKEISSHAEELKQLEDAYLKIQKEIAATSKEDNKGKSQAKEKEKVKVSLLEAAKNMLKQ